MKPYADKTLTETMLAKEYSNNGLVFDDRDSAMKYLENKRYVYLDRCYRGKGGKVARIYPLRDAILDRAWPHKPTRFVSRGFLVSFGGEPRSCYDLKFSKIKKPMI